MIAPYIKEMITSKSASAIRKMFEQGKILKAKYGDDKVFDFSLGNPDLDPPGEVLNAIEEIAKEKAIQFKAIHLQSKEEAQNAPTPITTYALFLDGNNITIQDGNYDGITNTFEDAKKDWQTNTYTLDYYRSRMGGIVFANPK